MGIDLFLKKSEYYAPFPMLKLNTNLIIGDMNLASRNLSKSMEHKVFERSIEQAISDLQIGQINNFNTKTYSSLSTEKYSDAFLKTCDFHLYCREFGEIDTKLTIICLPDPGSVELIDRTVYVEIKHIDHEDIYRSRLQASLEHQLIWENYAQSYDLVLQELDFYREVVNRHCCAMIAEGILRVIDIGAGTGNVAIPLLEAGRSVSAVDISRAMLDRMRSKLSTQNSEKINIIQQDGKDLSTIDDCSFDGANILLALFDMGEPESALNEVFRVLRIGGSLIITEPKRAFNLSALLSHAEKFFKERGLYEKLKPHWDRVSKVNKKIDPSKRSTPLFIEDILELIKNAGFSITRMEDSHYGNCATIWAVKTKA